MVAWACQIKVCKCQVHSSYSVCCKVQGPNTLEDTLVCDDYSLIPGIHPKIEKRGGTMSFARDLNQQSTSRQNRMLLIMDSAAIACYSMTHHLIAIAS